MAPAIVAARCLSSKNGPANLPRNPRNPKERPTARARLPAHAKQRHAGAIAGFDFTNGTLNDAAVSAVRRQVTRHIEHPDALPIVEQVT